MAEKEKLPKPSPSIGEILANIQSLPQPDEINSTNMRTVLEKLKYNIDELKKIDLVFVRAYINKIVQKLIKLHSFQEIQDDVNVLIENCCGEGSTIDKFITRAFIDKPFREQNQKLVEYVFSEIEKINTLEAEQKIEALIVFNENYSNIYRGEKNFGYIPKPIDSIFPEKILEQLPLTCINEGTDYFKLGTLISTIIDYLKENNPEFLMSIKFANIFVSLSVDGYILGGLKPNDRPPSINFLSKCFNCETIRSLRVSDDKRNAFVGHLFTRVSGIISSTEDLLRYYGELLTFEQVQNLIKPFESNEEEYLRIITAVYNGISVEIREQLIKALKIEFQHDRAQYLKIMSAIFSGISRSETPEDEVNTIKQCITADELLSSEDNTVAGSAAAAGTKGVAVVPSVSSMDENSSASLSSESSQEFSDDELSNSSSVSSTDENSDTSSFSDNDDKSLDEGKNQRLSSKLGKALSRFGKRLRRHKHKNHGKGGRY